jgi:hypothetical protein
MMEGSMVDQLILSLEALSKKTVKLGKLLREYAKLKLGVAENAYVLEKKLMAISALVDDLPSAGLKEPMRSWLDNEKKEIERGKDEFKFQFGNILKDLFKADGFELRGQYPLLRFGIYTIKLNFELGEATLYFGPEVEKIRSKIPLQAKVIHEIVVQHRNDVGVDKTELPELAKDLRTAYERCVKRDGRTYGERIYIMDVLREYVFIKQPKSFSVDARRDNFREYPRAKLSFMLYQLRDHVAAEPGMRLHVATFDATLDRSKTLWVPENDEGTGTHYEYISFETPRES